MNKYKEAFIEVVIWIFKPVQQFLCIHPVYLTNGKAHHLSNSKNIFRLECKMCNKAWKKTGEQIKEMNLKASKECSCEYKK